GVREVRLVAADSLELVLHAVVGYRDRLGVDLASRAVVAGDDAGHGRLALVRCADADRHLLAGAKPAATGRVVDLDRRRADAAEVAVLEGPRELRHRRAAQAS